MRAAIAYVGQRPDFRIVHFSVQHNHLHLIVEADSRRAMSDGLRALFAQLARDLNVVMRVAGRRFDERFHEHVLRTPTEVRNALRYVLGNRAVHLARWGRDVRGVGVDPLSSLVVQIAKPPQSWVAPRGLDARGPPLVCDALSLEVLA